MNVFVGMILFLGLFILGATWYSLRHANNQVKGFWWDYITPPSAIAIWNAMPELGIGRPISGGNFVYEQLALFIVCLVVLRVRASLAMNRPGTSRALLSLLYLVPSILAVVMRMTIPDLPE